MTSTEIDVRQEGAVAVVQDEMTIEQLEGQVQLIQKAMSAVMKKGEHYGTIPGAGSRQILFKAGAEKLCLLFRLDPEYQVQETYHDDGHYTVTVNCKLIHITTGNRMGSGLGLCTTQEKKYAFRSGQPNLFLPDSYNTVLKMACKRALVAAVLNTTAASDIFTQDLEEAQEAAPVEVIPPLNQETLQALVEAIVAVDYAPELWAVDVVLANASRKFGRQIPDLLGLKQDEALMITTAAREWATKNPEQVEESEVVEEEPAQEPEPAEVPEEIVGITPQELKAVSSREEPDAALAGQLDINPADMLAAAKKAQEARRAGSYEGPKEAA